MTQAKPRFRTIEDYLEYDDGTDTRYELVDGELIALPTEDPINSTIAAFLLLTFAAMGIPPRRFAIGHQIEVTSADVSARQPDLVVHTDESITALLSGEKLIRIAMPAPMLVVEVVSPGKPGTENYDRDYVDKPKEYAARGISEFWRVDPSRAVVAVLSLRSGSYRIAEFRGTDPIVSPTFPNLQLTAEQVLNAG
ncbi:MAG: Uma2 family endonuclease [Leptolyngbya sp. UWPOB_LEPTO1]|uniref:Uma2 family endonuclease n=1 Tax=Leptolyngbya sp. UWPOB_LEPTO1 TaxID=2815653 RepID=UPI001ACAB488|nr:Uma2 family endonuclease [Leptolyngbya sp. UWPOB_LEPTO1]MBN8562495.1 Uma2 family endonuclease [Leptolyngbya sp. UWPOB_LEPTO1]